jgi:DMSO/TMAO reductase YedYZ molybdopterin-dependent catalytic subunit
MPIVSRRRLLVAVGAAAFTVVLRPFPALADLIDRLCGHSESKATKPITPNDEFYVTSYLSPPTIQVGEWLLPVTGLVERPIVLTYEQLVGRPTV